ncbi:MAG: FAD-binding protein [Acidobacteriota bacterium]
MEFAKLRSILRGQVVTDEEALQDVSTDFGRLVQSQPKAIVVPASSQDIQRVVEFANREPCPISIRGAGHSQSGQSLSRGGLLLDMMALNRVYRVKGDAAWVDAGITWRELVERLTVVTGTGDVAVCSSTENSDLFKAVRAGLGQFGIITRAKLRLRPFSENVRTYYLLYDSAKSLLADQQQILHDQRFDFIEGWCTPCVQGMKTLGSARIPFAEWFFPLQVSVEYAGGAPGDSVLSHLNYYRRVHTEDSSLLAFLKRMDAVFEHWYESGGWKLPHPWMEALLPWDGVVDYLEGVVKSLPPSLLGDGQLLLWPCRGTVSETPMLARPDGEFIMGFGIQPVIPRRELEMVLTLLRKASDLVIQVGGRRYLSGWVEFDHARWKSHFGSHWPRVLEWKRFFDPNGILNPDFVQYAE